MATDAGETTGFGEVSRTVGRVFHAVLVVATLIGIVALGILLAYVIYDAIQPQTADPGWYLLYLGTVALPTLLVVTLLWRRTERGLTVGGIALGIPTMGVLFGAGLSMLFIDVIPPSVWLDYALAFAAPVLLIVALERRRRLPFLAKLALAAGGLVASLLVLPGLLHPLTAAFREWIAIWLTLGFPTALLVGRFLGRVRESRRIGRLATAAVLLGTPALAFAGGLVGIDPLPGLLLALTAAVPTATYATVVLAEDGADERAHWGLALPGVIIIGGLAAVLLADLLGAAGPHSWVDWSFLTSPHRNQAEQAGVYPAIVGSVLLMIIVALSAFPIGIGAAVYLEEYAPDTRFTRIIDVNISNLAGVPSVVYGLLGLGMFVTYGRAEPGTVLVGGFTLALLILPIVIISAREAVRSVPSSLRDASYGMGATRWQTIKNVVLPESFPGILTGTILALGRAIGETAPLLVIGAPQVFDVPTELGARVGAMPLQIYVWATAFAGPDFYQKALPAGVVVLLVILIAMNAAAIVTRSHYEREA